MTDRFVVIHGDAGLGAHNSGQLFRISAETHVREIRAHSFPDVPELSGSNTELYHISSVPELVADIDAGNVAYLAYFGHSWAADAEYFTILGYRIFRISAGWGRLYIGERAVPGSNLGETRTATTAAVADLPQGKFAGPRNLSGVSGGIITRKAQIRLFGCRGGYGSNPMAALLANHLKVEVYGYDNSGGSLFTQDPRLGHGQRAVTQSDINFSAFNDRADTWLVPANGMPRFKKF
jgi:hypothetical protein